MFYLLRRDPAPFGPNAATVVDEASTVPDLAEKLRALEGEIIVAEVLFTRADGEKAAPAKAIPPELQRGVEEWNLISQRITPKRPKVTRPENYLSAYRRWKSRTPGRTYLLEDLVRRVERAAWCHGFVNFGYLFGMKDGTLNSDRLIYNGETFKKPQRKPAGNGAEFDTEGK